MINKHTFIQAAIFAVIFNVGFSWYKSYYAAPEPLQQYSSISDRVIAKPVAVSSDANRYIHVETDKLHVLIDREGGGIVRAELADHVKAVGRPELLAVLDAGEDQYLGALTGISGDSSLRFSAAKSHYVLAPNQDSLMVRLHATAANGLKYYKRYTFKPGTYVMQVESSVDNVTSSSHAVQGYHSFFGDRKQSIDGGAPKPNDLVFGDSSGSSSSFIPVGRLYSGLSHYSNKKPYVRDSYEDLAKGSDPVAVKGGWLALQRGNFVSAWVLDEAESYQINGYWSEGETQQDAGTYEQTFASQATGPQVALNPGDVKTDKSSLYVGPASPKLLSSLAPGIKMTVDYGFFWMLASLLFTFLELVHGFLPNWGIAIIVTTILVRGIFYKPTKDQILHAQKVKLLKPELDIIEKKHEGKERFDQQKNEEVFALYKKHNVSMLNAGCLMSLIQLPLMIAFYNMISASVEFRHASFLWFSDLSAPDPYFILPFVVAAAMFFQNEEMSPGDESTKTVFRLMPLIFLAVGFKMPAAVMIYLTSSFSLGILQSKLLKKYKKK